jgi:dimethylargininase
MFTRAIVRQPPQNFSEGHTSAELGAPDYELALRQHEAYCMALEQCGLELIRLEADSDYPDSTFVEDTAVIITKPAPSVTVGLLPRVSDETPKPETRTHRAMQVVLTRPGAASRRGEVTSITKAFEDFFSAAAMQTIEPPGKLDGGDVCEAGNHLFIGVSERTNEAGAQQLNDLLARLGCRVGLMDIREVNGLLHLKSGLAYLGNNRLVVTEALVDRAEFAGYELISVKAGEQYAANCVRVNDHVLMAAGFPSFESTVRRLGYQTIVLEMSEFQKMDGGLSCLSLRF